MQATFDNTIVAMEKSGQLLNRATTVFFNLSGANTNDDAGEDPERNGAQAVGAPGRDCAESPSCSSASRRCTTKRDTLGLDAESKRLVERYYTDFVRAGAKLNDADKAKLKAFNAELATLQTQFSQNMLKENNASAVIVDSKDQLKGMSDGAIAAAAEAAKQRKLDGKYVIALQNTSRPAGAGAAAGPRPARASAEELRSAAPATAASSTTAPSSPRWRRSAPSALRCWVTKTTLPIRWKTKPPRP